jgi:hypothetical protein
MLIVEADAENRVRIYPYDLITSNFFPFTWKIDEAWNPDSYLYTDKRYKSDLAPYFDDNAKIEISDEISNYRNMLCNMLMQLQEQESGN